MCFPVGMPIEHIVDRTIQLNELYYAIEDTVAYANSVEERIWIVGHQKTRPLATMKQLCVNHNRFIDKLHTLVVAFGELPGVTDYNDWVRNEKPAEYARYIRPSAFEQQYAIPIREVYVPVLDTQPPIQTHLACNTKCDTCQPDTE